MAKTEKQKRETALQIIERTKKSYIELLDKAYDPVIFEKLGKLLSNEASIKEKLNKK